MRINFENDSFSTEPLNETLPYTSIHWDQKGGGGRKKKKKKKKQSAKTDMPPPSSTQAPPLSTENQPGLDYAGSASCPAK